MKEHGAVGPRLVQIDPSVTDDDERKTQLFLDADVAARITIVLGDANIRFPSSAAVLM